MESPEMPAPGSVGQEQVSGSHPEPASVRQKASPISCAPSRRIHPAVRQPIRPLVNLQPRRFATLRDVPFKNGSLQRCRLPPKILLHACQRRTSEKEETPELSGIVFTLLLGVHWAQLGTLTSTILCSRCRTGGLSPPVATWKRHTLPRAFSHSR